jgi:tRNA A-37 threonylcarbamoyl transferase component Bud32
MQLTPGDGRERIFPLMTDPTPVPNESIRWETAPGFESWPTTEFERRLPHARILKDHRKKAVLEVDFGGTTWLVKMHRSEGAFRRLASGSRAEHEFRMNLKLVEAGIQTVPIVAFGTSLGSDLVVMEKMKGWTDLQRILLDGSRSFPEIRERIRAYGRFARRLHDAGVWQHDFNPTNILTPLDPAGRELKVIDFERMKWKSSISAGERHRSLAKMNRIPRLGRTDRMRFLRAYLEGGEERVGGVARLILDLFRKKATEDAKKLARLCMREGRRFGEFRTDNELVFFRKGGERSTPEGISPERVGALLEEEWPGFERRGEKDPLQAWKSLHRDWRGDGTLPVAVQVDSSTGEGWLIFRA